MELKNNAQNKKFATNSAVIEKGGTVGTFYLRPNRTEKSFQDLRVVKTMKQTAPTFYSDAANTALLQKRTANRGVNFPTSQVRDTNISPDADKAVASRTYPGERPFLEEGKSQKSLNRQNRPLTIDEVRELLNKNK